MVRIAGKLDNNSEPVMFMPGALKPLMLCSEMESRMINVPSTRVTPLNISLMVVRLVLPAINNEPMIRVTLLNPVSVVNCILP